MALRALSYGPDAWNHGLCIVVEAIRPSNQLDDEERDMLDSQDLQLGGEGLRHVEREDV